jgi:hypothetical protein
MIRLLANPLPAESCLSFSVSLCVGDRAYIREREVGGDDGEKAWPSIYEYLILSGSKVGERKRRKEQRNTRNERRGQEGRKGARGYLKDRTLTRTAVASSLNGA